MESSSLPQECRVLWFLLDPASGSMSVRDVLSKILWGKRLDLSAFLTLSPVLAIASGRLPSGDSLPLGAPSTV